MQSSTTLARSARMRGTCVPVVDFGVAAIPLRERSNPRRCYGPHGTPPDFTDAFYEPPACQQLGRLALARFKIVMAKDGTQRGHKSTVQFRPAASVPAHSFGSEWREGKDRFAS
jgi:hypothetical protein